MEVVLETKATANAVNTVTLTPLSRSNSGKGDLTDTIASILVTFTTTRDTNYFDVLNREYNVAITRR